MEIQCTTTQAGSAAASKGRGALTFNLHRCPAAVSTNWEDSPNSITLATSCEELTHWKRLWCWEGLVAGGEGEEKGRTEDEMAGWHHWLDGRESQWTPGVGNGQGGQACCDSWGREESDTTDRLIWSDLIRWIYSTGFRTYITQRVVILIEFI